MKKIIGLCALICLMGCGAYNRSVRNSYKDKKLAYPSVVTNIEKVANSSFKNYLFLKTSRTCDFDLRHFLSYSYHYRSQYTSTDVDIRSSLIEPLSLFTAFANVRDDYFQKTSDGSYLIRSYLLSNDETLLTKDLFCEIRLRKPDLIPGDYDGNTAELRVFNERGTVLFDSKFPGTKFHFAIKEIKDRILYAEMSGECSYNDAIFSLHSGKLWVKM